MDITNKNSHLKDMDDDILSGMFTAIQDFVKDIFKHYSKEGKLPDKDAELPRVDEWQIKQLKLEGHNILIEHCNHAFLAVIYTGTAGWKLRRLMKNTMDDIEEKYANVLPNWKGKMEKFAGIDEYLGSLMN